MEKKYGKTLLIIVCLIMTFPISLQPKQKELKNVVEKSDYGWVGYGGARGGGKSIAVDDIALLFGFKYKTYSLIFRRYYNELLDNHINPLFERFPELRKYYNASDKIIYHPSLKIPIIRFGYAENETDIYKFQGPSYPLIFVDEATQCTPIMIQFLKTSNRDPQGRFPSVAKIILTGNPGGVGHTFIKRIFIDKVYRDNEQANDYYFIQAHVWDNVCWSLKELRKQGFTVSDYYNKWTEKQRIDFTIKYSDYAKNLSGLPDQLRLAYLWGKWDAFAGMFFKGFDSSKEIIQPFEIPPIWEIVGSLDPGFAAPLSFGITAKDLLGNVYRVGTYYNVDSIPNHAIAVRRFLKDETSPIYKYLRGRLPKLIVAGRDAFSKVDKNAIVSNEDTIFDYFQNQGLTLMKGNDGPGSRISNWWKWKSLIPERYFIFRDLNNPLVEQMTSMEADDKAVEDIKGRGDDSSIEDHALDEQKLGIYSLFQPITKIEDLSKPKWLRDLAKKEEKKDFMEL